MLRRSLMTISVVAAYHRAKPVMAHSSNTTDLQTIVTTLNQRDQQTARKHREEEVERWEAAPSNIQYTNISDELLNELYYMTAFYNKPLSIEKKINARRLLAMIHQKTPNEEDKACIMAILQYFDLLE